MIDPCLEYDVQSILQAGVNRIMSERESTRQLNLRYVGKIWLAWLAAAALLLLLSSFILSRTATSERTLACFSSAISFLAACAAGARVGKACKETPFLGGLLCAVFLIVPLLLCGFLVDHGRMNADSVLSLASLSLAGALVGSVFLSGAYMKKRARGHGGIRPQGRKRRC